MNEADMMLDFLLKVGILAALIGLVHAIYNWALDETKDHDGNK